MLDMISVVFKSLFGKPATRNYPYVVRPDFEGARGHLVNDIEACIFCGMCVRRCPTKALAVNRAEGQWTIEPGRCIICGACVEVCPRQCLSLSTARQKPMLHQETQTLQGVPPAAKRAAKAETAPAKEAADQGGEPG